MVLEHSGVQVVLDEDVARLFGVETRRLNEQVRRNAAKFAGGAAYRLTAEEFGDLRSQNAMSTAWGGRRHPPTVFTEAGVALAATVLNTPRAIEASRYIVQVFLHARRQQIGEGRRPFSPEVVRSSLLLTDDTRRTLGEKAEPSSWTSVGCDRRSGQRYDGADETHAIVLQGLDSLSELLKRPGVQNERVLAEAQRLLAGARNLDADTTRKTTETAHRELALLAKQLRLVLLAQDYLETGRMEGLLDVLEDLSRT